MKKQNRPFEPTLDELQALLNVKNPGDLPDAVRELQTRAAQADRMRAARDGLLEKLVEEVEKEQGS